MDVINRGFSGYNTVWAIPVFEQVRLLAKLRWSCCRPDEHIHKVFAKQHEQQHLPKVRLLSVWFGANDAAIPPSPQHVLLPEFIANMKHIINMIKSPSSPHYSPETEIILITPPPVNTYQREEELANRDPPLKLDREFEVTRSYAMAVKEVGEEAGLGVADVWTKIWEKAGKNERALNKYLWDGLHLTSEGYEVYHNLS
jgi:isoamyl acetate esterase